MNRSIFTIPCDLSACTDSWLDGVVAAELWATHYGWMYRDPEPQSVQVDPAFFQSVLQWDREAGVDGIVLFAPRIETGRIASQQGIFARREPPPEAIAAASHEGGESPHPQPHEDADRLTG